MNSIYFRNRNTRRNGGQFTLSEIQAVWAKGQIVAGYDSSVWRKDVCGAWMKRNAYGDTNSSHGWEIDHKVPVSQGGGDQLYNLQPLQWQNNRHKGDNYPNWSCKISST